MSNPFSATLGLRVEPAPVGSGISFNLDFNPRRLPIYIYKNTANLIAAMNEYVRFTLREGLFGWSVTDCVVTMDECGYYVGDGRGKPTGGTPANDSRRLSEADADGSHASAQAGRDGRVRADRPCHG